VDIAKNCGINVNRAIVVDSHMKTNIEDIYSAGDICEYNGMTWGLWSEAIEQGKIAGINAAGGIEEYKEISPSSLLQVMDLNIFSTGNISDKNLAEAKYDGNVYSKLFFDKGIIKGAILIGNTRKGFLLKKAIEEKRNFTKELLSNQNILEII
jgi:nitrite reductase (NADH) large subunit